MLSLASSSQNSFFTFTLIVYNNLNVNLGWQRLSGYATLPPYDISSSISVRHNACSYAIHMDLGRCIRMHVWLHVYAIADLALNAVEGTASLGVEEEELETKYNWVNLRR